MAKISSAVLAKGGNMKQYFCPLCQAPADETETGNGGELYVAEDLESSTECYDLDIKMFQCSKNSGHIFYMD